VSQSIAGRINDLPFRHLVQGANPNNFSYMLYCYTKEQPTVQARLLATANGTAVCSKEDEIRQMIQDYCILIDHIGSVEPVHDSLMSELDTLCSWK
jgi:hypothetical protein